jgi:mannose-6-phosphate isomerase-like protein (cupin superfamily)
MGLLGTLSNLESQERLGRLAAKLDRLAGSTAAPRPTSLEPERRCGEVSKAVVEVLRELGEPLRMVEIHAAVEGLLGEQCPVPRSRTAWRTTAEGMGLVWCGLAGDGMGWREFARRTPSGSRGGSALGVATSSPPVSLHHSHTEACARSLGRARILSGASHRDLAGPGGAEMNSRIAAVPFTLRNLKEDLDDLGSNFDGAPDLEFRHASKVLELEQCGLCYQRIPPDYRFPYGHTHKEQEEIYVVVRGSGRMKLGDEIVEVKEWDVVRVPPGTWRGYEGGPEGLEILVFGAPNLGENPRDDVEGQRDWWAD